MKIVDRWSVLCGLTGLTVTLFATDWNGGAIALTTGASMLIGLVIGGALSVRLIRRHDAWMKKVWRQTTADHIFEQVLDHRSSRY